MSEEICPVCGYYCLGKGGVGCIDKPSLLENLNHNDECMKDFDDARKAVEELL